MKSPAKNTLFLLLLCLSTGLTAASVTKVVDRFQKDQWVQPPWNKVVGILAEEEGSLSLTVPFAGKGFQYCGVNPASPLPIPGTVQSYEIEFLGNPEFPVAMQFTDGWGRTKVGKADLKHELVPTGAWQVVTFDVPGDWVQPVRLSGVSVHNFTAQNKEAKVQLRLRRISATVDADDADPATGLPASWVPLAEKKEYRPSPAPIFGMAVVPDAPAAVFAGREPGFTVTLRSWLAGSAKGRLTWRATTWDGKDMADGQVDVNLEDMARISVKPPAGAFGVHRLSVVVKVRGQDGVSNATRYGHLPTPVSLTAEEHGMSPYGLCVHGGRQVLPEAFAAAGIRWFRDYSFNWEWMAKSEGADHQFTGWPNHRMIADAYLSKGLGFLPILTKSISRPGKNALPSEVPGPGQEFDQRFASILRAFPTVSHWELDNEYDLKNAAWESTNGWTHYQDWHRHFGDFLAAQPGRSRVAVENGRAGIFPALVRQAVKSGAFDRIGVVNAHHYCGADAPEMALENRNTGFDGGFASADAPAIFLDRLRDLVAAAGADGKKREVWLSETGWDDLAGPRVDTLQKAAYLPRGFFTAMAAGVSRTFWYFDLSTAPAKAANFFDGCGLLSADLEPEPALVAMAAMARALPAPTWLGPVEGPDYQGALFRSRGERVLVLWAREGKSPSVQLKARLITDGFGNPVPSGTVKLAAMPVYAIGVDGNDPLVQDADFDIASHRWVRVAQGDSFEVALSVQNRGDAALAPEFRWNLPKDWTAAVQAPFRPVAPGASGRVLWKISVPNGGSPGDRTVGLSIRRKDGTAFERTVAVAVVPPLQVEAARIQGGRITARIRNMSERALSPKVTLDLPAEWKVEGGAVKTPELKPGEWTTFEGTATCEPGRFSDKPMAKVDLGRGATVVVPILPPRRHLAPAGNLRLDGDFSDWPEEAWLTADHLGATGEGGARLAMAWGEKGLYVAAKVLDGGRQTRSPKTFWMGDALEVFIAADGREDKRTWRSEDHHFWIVPRFEKGNVFVGHWGHGQATENDLSGIESAASKVDDGYVMELLIPAKRIKGFAPAAGRILSAALTLSIHGSKGSQEVYWPVPKAEGISWQPGLWGSFLLD